MLPYLIGYAAFVLFVALLIRHLLPHWRGWRLILATTLVGTLAVSLVVAFFLSWVGRPQNLVAAMMTHVLLAAIPVAFVIGFVVSGLTALMRPTPNSPKDHAPPN